MTMIEKTPLMGLVDKASATGGISYITSAIAGLILMAIAAFTGYTFTRLKRKEALLKLQLAKAKEEKFKATEDMALSANETYRMVAQANLGHWEEQVTSLRKKRLDVSVKSMAAKDRIDTISSWDDINIIDKRDQNDSTDSNSEPSGDPSSD